MRRSFHVLALAAFAALATAVAPARAEVIYGITGTTAGNSLVFFDSSSPGTVTTVGALSGVLPGHSVRAIDFRPATLGLYAMSNNAAGDFQLYTVDTATAVLTPVGAPVPVGYSGSRISMDFNPVVDRLRVVTGALTNNNFRFNPDTGALVATDGNFAYDAGDPQAGNSIFMAGVAYTNNFAGATSTTLYGWDYNNDSLVTVGSIGGSPISPNTGTTFTVFTPPSFLTFAASIGFDISGQSGTAYVSHDDPGTGTTYSLYTIDLSTGTQTLVGAFPQPILDISVQAIPEPTSFVLAGLGIGGFVWKRRRGSKNAV
jgi:hypothetical protein